MDPAARTAVTLPGECELRMTRRFEASRERLFDFYTKAEWLKRWLGPEGWDFAVCDNDPVSGGRYRWLWRDAQGRELGMHGEYLKVVRPAEILRTEIFDQDSGRRRDETLGWLLFAETGRGTLVITSVLFPTREARDAALAAGIDRGMAASLDRLELLLALDRSNGAQSAA
jgi:uncharacterized protein YndB with AHSA1/START domain